jgi:hypothetical protein
MGISQAQLTEVKGSVQGTDEVARMWRLLKMLKWNGFHQGRKVGRAASLGDLVLFCAACPQPGINIPAEVNDLSQ